MSMCECVYDYVCVWYMCECVYKYVCVIVTNSTTLNDACGTSLSFCEQCTFQVQFQETAEFGFLSFSVFCVTLHQNIFMRQITMLDK